MIPLRYIDDKNTKCIFFRRTTPQLTGQGGLWDTAMDMYMKLPTDHIPRFRHKALEAKFPSGATFRWRHMEHVKNKLDHQGLQYTTVLMDEGTQFEWEQIEYMMSRLRSASKYPSRMIISCNPDPDHYLRTIIAWHLDEEGYPIPERDGVIRWFIRRDGEFVWGMSKEELHEKYGEECLPLSFTFISATIYDNPPMLTNNKEYLAFLEGLNEVDKAQLLHGNWNARPKGASYFQREFLKIAEKVPLTAKRCRPWDKAGTERSTANKSPDFTATVGVAKCKDGFYYLYGNYHEDNQDEYTQTQGRFCKRSGERDLVIQKQAEKDGDDTAIIFSIDPGQAGLAEFATSSKTLAENGYTVKKDPTPTNKSKLTRFTPFAILAEQGFVYIVKNSFSPETYEAIMKELESFNGERSTGTRHDDWADAIASGVNYLAKTKIHTAVSIPQYNAPTMKAIAGL